jgi:hypothetical protein
VRYKINSYLSNKIGGFRHILRKFLRFLWELVHVNAPNRYYIGMRIALLLVLRYQRSGSLACICTSP